MTKLGNRFCESFLELLETVFAGFGIEAFIGEAEAFDWLSIDDVGFDDFIDVGFGDVSVPDGFWIDDEIRPVFALIEAPGLVGANASLQTTGGEFLLKEFLQVCVGLRIAASARMACWALIAADEDVVLELWHRLSS